MATHAPQPDKLTAGFRKPGWPSCATLASLEELYPELWRPLAPVFGPIRTGEVIVAVIQARSRP